MLSGAYNPRLGLGLATPTEASAGGTNELPGEGSLFVGQSYLLEVPASAGVERTRQVFRVEGPETTLHVPLRRATCTLQLQMRSEQANSGHWSAPLLLPPGVCFHVMHAALGKEVARGLTDGQGCALLSGQSTLYVNQKYVLHVAATAAVHAAHVEFVAAEGTTAVELPLRRKVTGRPACRTHIHTHTHTYTHIHIHTYTYTYA